MLTRRLVLSAVTAMTLAPFLARAADRQAEAPLIEFSEWQDDEPLYLFFPGDKLEVSVTSAPELNRQTQVGADGRITLPQIGQVMAAYKSVPQLQEEISGRYAQVLRYPDVTVFPGDTAPTRVLVGGEVRTPGWVEVQGDMDALQAIMAAGGFLPSARSKKVVIIRRGHDGRAMRRTIDLKSILSGERSQMTALRRFDILFVPRTSIAEAGLFVDQWVNQLIPGGILNYFMYRTFN
jgi:polysaccharide biosynthesis/export protein PslD